NAYIDQNVRLVGAGNLTIQASSDITASSQSRSKSGGFVGVASGDARTHTNFSNTAQILDNADVLVDGRAKIWTDSKVNDDANAYASGIGAGGDGDSHTEAYNDSGNSLAQILNGASLIAKEVSFKGGLSFLNLHAHGEAYGAGFYAQGEDDSSVGGTINAKTVLGANTLVTGMEGVDLLASTDNVTTRPES